MLQAGTHGHGGEIFLLDMGEPVRIVDLARDMIRLSGLEPDEDIEIGYIGLRRGEKLYEELITAGEGVAPTAHEKVMVLRAAAAPATAADARPGAPGRGAGGGLRAGGGADGRGPGARAGVPGGAGVRPGGASAGPASGAARPRAGRRQPRGGSDDGDARRRSRHGLAARLAGHPRLHAGARADRAAAGAGAPAGAAQEAAGEGRPARSGARRSRTRGGSARAPRTRASRSSSTSSGAPRASTSTPRGSSSTRPRATCCKLKGDTGAYLRSTMGALVLFGVPPEEFWPYERGDVRRGAAGVLLRLRGQLPHDQLLRARPAGDEAGRADRARQDLPRRAACPSMFGFTVYTSIEQAGADGAIPFPGAKEKVAGGHADRRGRLRRREEDQEPRARARRRRSARS